MTRYKAYVADECVFETKPTIPSLPIICNDDMIDTGLCDSSGNKIYREKTKVGFLSK